MLNKPKPLVEQASGHIFGPKAQINCYAARLLDNLHRQLHGTTANTLALALLLDHQSMDGENIIATRFIHEETNWVRVSINAKWDTRGILLCLCKGLRVGSDQTLLIRSDRK